MSQPTGKYAHPEGHCDLVMKGGITSGVVFPPAVLKLAEKFRIHCIGGASAGAIAAAFTAAAEYARQDGGFERLEAVSAELGKEGFIRKLFQPGPTTRPLFEALMSLAKAEGAGLVRLFSLVARLTGITLRYYGWGYLLGAGLGLLLWFFNLWAVGGTVDGWRSLFAVAFTGFVAWLTGLVLGLRGLSRILQHALRPNFFGLCNGYSNRTGSDLVMTQWLYESIQHIAGRPLDKPLLLEDLDKKDITFKMISSNLSQGRPYSLPFRENTFLFKDDELSELFPPEVMQSLITHAHDPKELTTEAGLYFLPPAGKLPVVVAVRMSLSFPLLISAVPLHSVRRTAFAELRSQKIPIDASHLHEQWFSDGGISSNFPIHLFDAWIPSRPTFGITLGEFPKNPPKGLERVSLPGHRSRPFSGVEIQSFWAFLNAIWNTAQNHRDNTQAALPSYRERVVRVLLSEDEGGLNLDMAPLIVERMTGYGETAGDKLCHEFQFPAHQWLRLQLLMKVLETQVVELSNSINQKRIDPIALLAAQKAGTKDDFPNRRTQEPWLNEAATRLTDLHQLGNKWQKPIFTDDDAPAADAVLRVTPDL